MFVVTGAMTCGFVLWSLMIRRRFYREIRTTRFLDQVGIGILITAARLSSESGDRMKKPDESRLFAKKVRNITILIGRNQTSVESKGVALFTDRVRRRTGVFTNVLPENQPDAQSLIEGADLVILAGTPDHHDLLRSHMKRENLKTPMLPDTDIIHPEGFAIKTTRVDRTPYVLVAGADQRGVIYGIGALLRQITFLGDCIEVPEMESAEKPAFPYRGTVSLGVSPNRLMQEPGKMRRQTNDEVKRGVEDMFLLGANTLRHHDELAISHGMMTSYMCSANDLVGEVPEEWAASPSSSLHIKVNEYFAEKFVCPSIPEARRALLESYERRFGEYEQVDLFTIKSGDVGGCICEKCTPFGGVFIELVHEVSKILKKIHPEAKLLITSQNLSDQGNRAILEYLYSGDPSWLFGLRYAPGGNEMSTYNRPPINPEWFEYEGFGWSNYLKNLHHMLPAEVNILLMSDMTHWIRSQYGIDKPDIAPSVIYNRRAWNARPRAYHEIAREALHYSIGDVLYSEGMHDDFNKWLFYRLLWNPHLSAEEIAREYCRYWFGPDAEDEMAEAIFLMEETLELPFLGNKGIRRAVELLQSAREKIPENLMTLDHRWRIILQKAILDLYIQLWLERGEELKSRASVHLEEALKSKGSRDILKRALAVLEESQETGEMADLRERVRKLGEESNEIIGYREPAFFTMKEFDVTEVGWWIERVREALEASSEAVVTNLVTMILRYEDPGEGGFYERVGWPWNRIHLMEHQNIIGYFPFTGPARHHHYGMGYSWGRDDARMIFRYDDLDTESDYVVRLCVGFHCKFLDDFLSVDLAQTLEVNGVIVGEEIPIPLGDIRLVEFEIPRELIDGGKAEIVLRGATEEFPMAGLSGIWLMRKEKAPWRLSPE